MQVGLLEMPAEGVWRARYEEEKAPGYAKREPARKSPKKWVVYTEEGEPLANYYTKEAAMCRLLMGMFESQAIMLLAKNVDTPPHNG